MANRIACPNCGAVVLVRRGATDGTCLGCGLVGIPTTPSSSTRRREFLIGVAAGLGTGVMSKMIADGLEKLIFPGASAAPVAISATALGVTTTSASITGTLRVVSSPPQVVVVASVSPAVRPSLAALSVAARRTAWSARTHRKAIDPVARGRLKWVAMRFPALTRSEQKET